MPTPFSYTRVEPPHSGFSEIALNHVPFRTDPFCPPLLPLLPLLPSVPNLPSPNPENQDRFLQKIAKDAKIVMWGLSRCMVRRKPQKHDVSGGYSGSDATPLGLGNFSLRMWPGLLGSRMQPLLGASPAWWILLNQPPERDQCFPLPG